MRTSEGSEPNGDDGTARAASGDDQAERESADSKPGDAEGPRACPYPDYEAVGEAGGEVPATGDRAQGLEADVWDVLYTVEDPEMPVSIVDLGLIYGVTLADGHATVDMTLTYTGCPAREMLLENVEEAVESVPGVESASVRLVWSPGWTVDMITEDGAADLREFGLSV